MTSSALCHAPNPSAMLPPFVVFLQGMLEPFVFRVLGLRALKQLQLMLRGDHSESHAVSDVDFSHMTVLTQLHLELSHTAVTGG